MANARCAPGGIATRAFFSLTGRNPHTCNAVSIGRRGARALAFEGLIPQHDHLARIDALRIQIEVHIDMERPQEGRPCRQVVTKACIRQAHNERIAFTLKLQQHAILAEERT